MKLILSYTKLYFLVLLRQPTYVLSTLIFPSLFFMMFAHQHADEPVKANLLMASFSAFAVLGVAFLDFGVSVAKERGTSWMNYVRSLPVAPWKVFLAKSLNALIFSLAAGWVVMIVVNLTTDANLTLWDHTKLSFVMVAGMLPFAMMGYSIGYWTTAASSMSIANLIYLTLSFGGGLWIPPDGLPDRIAQISRYLPTRFYGEMVWASVLDTDFDMRNVWGAVIYFFIFLIIAVLGYRKDRA